MNLSNRLTIFRILTIPIFLFFLLTNSSNSIRQTQFIWAATIIFLISAITDIVDGYIARTKNEETEWGKLMDPIADKILVSSAIIALVELGRIPSWVAIIIIFREFLISGLRAVAATRNIIISASILGKAKTVIQTIAILITIINVSTSGISFFPISFLGIKLEWYFLIVAIIVTLASGLDYVWRFGATLAKLSVKEISKNKYKNK
ncbi:MAG: CDP-diacylglycerol--glycerol-3-phosphate 3-phosphatidyltransferase [Actinobacteria bacterium]|nr:CDP-diacylglycerol--glycerol-3-phosphate 3-phosphatidyltransferase [Actinomycetota bacterium]